MTIITKISLVFCFVLSLSCQTTKTAQTSSQTTKPNKQQFDDLKQANQYARDGLLREAIANYKVALKKNPKDLTARRNMGLVLVKIGDYKNAAEQLELASQKFNLDFDTCFYLAEALRGTENFADAIFWYQKANKIKPKHSKTLKALAWSYFNIRFYSETLKTAKKLYKITPKDPQTAIIIVRTLLKLKRPNDAFKVLKIAKRNSSRSTAAYVHSVEGDIYLELNQHKKAAKSYQNAIKDQPLLAGALLGLGRCSLAQGDQKKAITYLERAARIRPKMAETFYYLGRAYENTNMKKSIRYYSAFNRLASTDPEKLSVLSQIKRRTSMLKKS